MKKYLLLATICIAAFCSCEKGEPVPTKDIEIVFHQDRLEQIREGAIQEILNSKGANNIRNIYLIPEEGTWANFSLVQDMRLFLLQPALELSPKVRGKGDFNFYRGAASKVPEDSLWYVQHGWTINKRFIEN
ncbi:MAG: hypothetical protein J1D86_05390 [Alistipes sp.]|nr:hypothetical protein [Alistipes sp.]